MKTRTYRKLEAFFGQKITEFDKVDMTEKCGNIDSMINVIAIFMDAEKEGIDSLEVEKFLDDNDISPIDAFSHCISLLSGEPGKQKTMQLKELEKK